MYFNLCLKRLAVECYEVLILGLCYLSYTLTIYLNIFAFVKLFYLLLILPLYKLEKFNIAYPISLKVVLNYYKNKCAINIELNDEKQYQLRIELTIV